MPRRYVVLGAGISGLALGLYLKRSIRDEDRLTILEESDRTGGYIRTIREESFLFEQGPASCRTRGSGRYTLDLAAALNLTNRIVFPDPRSAKRYILHRDRLVPVPGSLWNIPFNRLTYDCWFKALLSDLTAPKRTTEDESIETFFRRRSGSAFFERLIDPFVSGIYAGDCSRLSLSSCFPDLDRMEQKYGSLLKSLPNRKEEEKDLSKAFPCAPLFSFDEGMETLPRALTKHLADCIKLRKKVERLRAHSDGIELTLTDGEKLHATHLISTIPAGALSRLFPKQAVLFDELRCATVVVVNLGFEGKLLPKEGFGYLVPSENRSPVLGCIWNSSVFPMHQSTPSRTCLNVMLGGIKHSNVAFLSESSLVETAREAIRKNMGIEADPKFVRVRKAIHAIPQYEIGYSTLKKKLLEEIRAVSPRIFLSGNAFSGVSVNDCIRHAQLLACRLVENF